MATAAIGSPPWLVSQALPEWDNLCSHCRLPLEESSFHSFLSLLALLYPRVIFIPFVFAS